jgi:hypothetical protein
VKPARLRLREPGLGSGNRVWKAVGELGAIIVVSGSSGGRDAVPYRARRIEHRPGIAKVVAARGDGDEIHRLR